MIVAGIEYLEDGDAEFFPDGSVHDATLARDTAIDGIPCSGGRSVVYYPNGRLLLASLARRAIIDSIDCATGLVRLYENGVLMNGRLADEHRFGPVVVPAGERVTLDEAGDLLEHSTMLTADSTIGGLPCSAAFGVWLYPTGRVSKAVLTAATVVNGHSYARGTELRLDDDGTVLETAAADLDSGQRYRRPLFGVYELPFE